MKINFKKISPKVLAFLITVYLSFTLTGCLTGKLEEEIVVDTEEELEKVVEEDLEKFELSIIIEELHKIIIDAFYTIRSQPFDVFQNLRETRDKLKSVEIKDEKMQKLLTEGVDEVIQGFTLYEKADIYSNEDEDAIKIIEEGKAKIDKCYDMLDIPKADVDSYIAEIEYICRQWNEIMGKSIVVSFDVGYADDIWDQLKELKRKAELIYTRGYTKDIQEIHKILINIIDETTSGYLHVIGMVTSQSQLSKFYGHIEKTQSYINKFHEKLSELEIEGILLKDVYRPDIEVRFPSM